ncbi:hypothetical protein CXZ10_06010 [Pleomorphomonas diazotrophica]|uniref:Uncharacterized protein n=1 Tax=Pleomorphomonas diazotrophica TaxID=1166257 RepID=A0A1I4Q6K8_9HYPH|nr:helix-turn-helix domain-containing protein [Pleomorphomonas diazotrophica]PKR90899.1 hypothetical protein CXZ10_06010 [Pleomorphomonas diazotrophica]SFM35687.1 hypothetical protein SAMN05192571_101109 [Pleomorphomonas diazotrophica]
MPSRQMPVVNALQGGACLTTAALAELTGLSDRDVAKACCSLVSRGWVVRRERGCFEMSAVGEKAIAAGGIITSGPTGPLTQAEPRRPRRQTVRDKMWTTMRTLKKFRIADLETLAGATRDNAQRYVGALERTEFLSRLRPEPGTAPTSNGFRRWLLVRNSGPDAPVYKAEAGEVYDRNTGIAYPIGGAP